MATEAGHAKLTTTTLSHSGGGAMDQQPVAEDEWYAVAESEFGLSYGADGSDGT